MAVHSGLAFTLVLACLICYYNSLNCGFVFDDISAVKDNRDLRPTTPLKNIFVNDFWGTPIQKEHSHKSYRPLCVLTFRWNYALHQLEPFGYHLVNMALHILVTVMYYKLSSMFLSDMASFVASMLFAVHPIHTEAVTGVVGRAETLSSVFFLLAFMLYSKATKCGRATGWKPLLMSMCCVAVAMFCKEQGITITGICFVYEVFAAQKVRLPDIQNFARVSFGSKSTGKKRTWPSCATKRIAVLIATTIFLLLVRLQIMGSRLPVFTRFDNPASVAPTPARQLTYNYLVSLNLWLLLFPCDLCCDWTMGTVPLVQSIFDIRNVFTLVSFSFIGYLGVQSLNSKNKRQSTLIIMGLAFLVLPFLPASNLFFPVGFVIAERILYIPSMGFCLLFGYGWSIIESKKSKKLAWIGFTALVLAHGLKTYTRNWDWESEYSIFTAGLKVNQQNAKLFNNVGHALEGQGKYEEALEYFNKAVSVQQDDIGAHINVGRTYNHLKMFKEAEEAYMKAKSLLPKAKPGETYQARIAPNHLNVFLNLANLIAKNETRLEEADMLYRQAISMRADYTQAYINRGDILLKLNRTKEAQEVYERALFYDSNNPDIYYNLGVVFLEQGKATQALAYLDKALEFDPEHEQALLNSAILLQELGRAELRKVARERLLKLLHKDSSNERVYFNLGMLSMDDSDVAGAEHWFRLAVQLKNDFRSALFNLALLLADDQRPLEAAPFLNQLVRFHPDHIKGLILLGDIYINNLKDLDAAENCYRRILQLDPKNVQGFHNLCVVYVERGNLIEAELCLEEVHKLAPKEEYIVRHLKIVQQRLYQPHTIGMNEEGEYEYLNPEMEDLDDHETMKYFEENQEANLDKGILDGDKEPRIKYDREKDRPGMIPEREEWNRPGMVPEREERNRPGMVPEREEWNRPGMVPEREERSRPGMVPEREEWNRPGMVPEREERNRPGIVLEREEWNRPGVVLEQEQKGRPSMVPEQEQKKKPGKIVEKEKKKKSGKAPEQEQKKKKPGKIVEKEQKKRPGKAPEQEQKKKSGKAPEQEQKKKSGKAPEQEQKKKSGKAPEQEKRKKSGKAPEQEQKKKSDKVLEQEQKNRPSKVPEEEHKTRPGIVLEQEQKNRPSKVPEEEHKNRPGIVLEQEQDGKLGMVPEQEQKKPGKLPQQEEKKRPGKVLEEEHKNRPGIVLEQEQDGKLGMVPEQEQKKPGKLPQQEEKKKPGKVLEKEQKKRPGKVLEEEHKNRPGIVLEQEQDGKPGMVPEQEQKKPGKVLEKEQKKRPGKVLEEELKNGPGIVLEQEQNGKSGMVPEQDRKNRPGKLPEQEQKRPDVVPEQEEKNEFETDSKATSMKNMNPEPLLDGNLKPESSTAYVQQKEKTTLPSQQENAVPKKSKPNKKRQNNLSGHDSDEVSLS